MQIHTEIACMSNRVQFVKKKTPANVSLINDNYGMTQFHYTDSCIFAQLVHIHVF
jgi:hypothetical protein